MSSSIFSNSSSYSYEDLKNYFETIEETPRAVDPILSYVRHLIQAQPDLQKFHDLESTLGQRIKEVGDDTALAALACQVSALMHQEMPSSLIAHALDDPESVVQILMQEGDDTIVFDTLLRLASLHPKQVIDKVSFFHHLTLNQRVSLAEMCALKAPLLVLKKINHFKIKNEKDELKIIKNVFSSSWDSFYEIDYINLSEEGLKDLATYCAQANPRGLIQKYYAFNINDSQFVCDQAFSLVQQYPELVFDCRDHFRLNPQPRAALIRACLHHSVDRAGMIAELIHLAVRSERDLVRIIEGELDGEILQSIAFACAKEQPQFLAKHLKKFKIEDQRALELLARQVADKNSHVLSIYIQEFGIENPDVRLELAKQVLLTSFQANQIKNFDILREEDRFDLAIRYLQIPTLTELTTNGLAQFEIKDPKNLLKLAKACMQRFPVETARLIGFFGIQSQEELFALAQASVRESKGEAIEHIPLFKLENPLHRIAIANVAAQYDGNKTASCIEAFDISDNEVLLDIATLCAKSSGKTIEHLDRFKIKDEGDRLKIALICSKRAPDLVVNNLHLIDLKDEQNRFKLASACAEAKPAYVAYRINTFKLGEENRIMMARLCMGPALPQEFKKFQISDPKQRVELAKECAKKYPKAVAAFIFEFKIEDKELEFELLKQCLQDAKFPTFVIEKIAPELSVTQQNEIARLLFAYDPHQLILDLEFITIDEKLKIDFLKKYASIPGAKVPNISHDKIEEESTRLELATLYAKLDPASFAPMISFYDIPDELERFQLAKICFQGDPSSISKSIAHFKLSSTHVYELAIECAKAPDSQFLERFRLFGLKDPNQIAEVALLSAQHNGAETVRRLSSFRMTDPNDLLRVIETCAQTAPQDIHTVINKRNIPSDAQRLALAKIAMVHSPKAILYLKQFGVESVADNQELINLYVSHFPEEFKQSCVHVIDPLFISSEEERKRLAIIGCEANPREAINFIHYFGIQDHSFLLELITKMAITADLGYVNSVFLMDWSEEERSQLYQMLTLTQKNLSITSLSEEVFSDCNKVLMEGGNTPLAHAIMQSHYPTIREFLSKWPEFIEIDQLPSEDQTLSFAQMKAYAVAYIGLKILSNKELDMPITKGKLKRQPILDIPIVKDLVKKILKHRNQSQAISYLTLLAYSSSPQMIGGLQTGTQMALKKGSRETYGKPLAPLLVPMLRVAKWGADCHHPELLHGLNQIFREPNIRERYFKAEAAGSDSMVQVWLKTVDILDEIKELSAERKIQLLTQAAQPITALRDRLLAIQGVIFSGAAQQLNRDFGPSMDEDLKDIIKMGLLADDYLDFKGIEDLEKKYMKTLAALRFPNGWKIYEQRLKEIAEIEVQQAYQRFIVGVLNGTFRQERYETTSPHIDLIRQGHEALWQGWQQEDHGKHIKVDGTNYQIMSTDNWQDLLLSGTEVKGSCQRIDGDPDLNKGLLAYLLDGKIRIVALKHPETGQIYARGLLRLMWDEQTHSPVLFFDKKYPEQLSEAAIEALDDYAIAQAQQLGCSIYSSEQYQEKRAVYHPLVSKGSCAPYEYADSASVGENEVRLMQHGQYVITRVYPMWIAV